MLSSQIYIFRGTPGWNVEATRAHRSAGPRESNQLNQTKPTQTKPNQPIPSRLVALNWPPSHSSTLCVCFYRHHCSIAVCRGLYFTVHQKLYSLTPFLGEKKRNIAFYTICLWQRQKYILSENRIGSVLAHFFVKYQESFIENNFSRRLKCYDDYFEKHLRVANS